MGSKTAWQPLAVDQQWPAKVFDVHCTECPRLHAFHEQNRQKFPDHFNGPVPPFGPENAEPADCWFGAWAARCKPQRATFHWRLLR